MQTIPLKAVPSQTLALLLSGQQVGLSLYVLADGNLYMDVLLNDVPVVTGIICQNNTLFVRNLYFGFSGDFSFNDTQGSNDPTFDGLGTRYQLLYFDATEVTST